MSFRWTISQIGARQHYGVPRGFFYRGELRLLYTDAWARQLRAFRTVGPAPLRALAGRYHSDIPSSKVVSFNLRTLADRVRSGSTHTDLREEYLYYVRFGQKFARWVSADLARRRLDPGEDLFFGFNTGCLETLEMLNDRKILSVCDQIDPARVEEQIIHAEAERWPNWQKLPGRIPQEYWQRMDAEWAAATLVLVNSNWSRQALISQGVPGEKILIIPPPYEPEKLLLPARRNMDKPLTVLWLGLVNLRKGIQYLIEAARLLEHNPRIRFMIAGPILIADHAVKSAPSNMQFLGLIPRSETGTLYRQADVFVLPTLSDGFAVSQLEAMSQALPVITTPNCGEVVSDGIDGFVVPAYSATALAAAIQKLDDDRQLLREMSYRALDKSTHFYLPRQAERLEEAITNFRKGKSLDETQLQLVPGNSPIRLESQQDPSSARPLPVRVAVVQDGARRRYMIPLALQQMGLLERVYTDWLVRENSFESKLASMVGMFRPKVGRRMRERSCAELDPRRVVSNWSLALRLRAKMRKFPVEEDSYLFGSHRTARWILQEGFANANVLYGFIRNAAPELFKEAKKQGLRTCGDQIIAPYQVEVDEMVRQQQRWPGWSKSETATLHQGYLKFENDTWEQLDQITCMSEYVRQGLISVGVADHRIKVIPYPWNENRISDIKREPHSKPLTVGFVGAVNLRKGAPYFLEVARRFDPRQVKFVMVGNVVLNQENLAAFPNVEFTGSVPRSQVNDWLKQFDLFFFPSTCEGSAGSVMEAMASGLPVLTTPNSGSRVRHGVDGFVYPYEELDSFENALRKLEADRDLIHQMGQSARGHILDYTLTDYARELGDFLSGMVNSGAE